MRKGRIRWICALLAPSLALAVAQIQDQGLQKSIDEFTGTVICEQQVIDAGHPNRLTIGIAVDERGVLTLMVHRSTLLYQEIVSPPGSWEEAAGVLFRFPDGEIVGIEVENWSAGEDGVVSTVDPSMNSQTHNLIIPPAFLRRLLTETEDVRFRLVDTDEGGERHHVDGTLTVPHLEPLQAFYQSCVESVL